LDAVMGIGYFRLQKTTLIFEASEWIWMPLR
jgi:hypothetical protein